MIRFCLLWMFVLAFCSSAIAQLQVLTSKYFYEEDNYDDCVFSRFHAHLPRFVIEKNDSSVKVVNDSVRHWFRRNTDLPDEKSFVVQHGDTLDKYFVSVSHDTNTCPGGTARPEQTSINYNVFMNTPRFLSFGIETEWIAGGNGIGYSRTSDPFTYDRKRNCWLTLDSLLMPGSDTLVKQLIDSLYDIKMEQPIPMSDGFIGAIAMSDTAMVAWCTYEVGSKGAMVEVRVPWKLLRKFLVPEYQKLFCLPKRSSKQR